VEWVVPLIIALVALMAVAVAVLWWAKIPGKWAPPYAVLRGALQLAVIAFVLRGVISSPVWVAVALAVMFSVAATTSARRLGFSWTRLTHIAIAMIAGVIVALGVVFTTGAIEFSPRYVLAVGGIVVGNSMTIATLAGRRLMISLNERWDEVEGWLGLGATPRESNLLIAREAVGEALVPTVDQTRTTGLVTLPGSFVGAIFGGASPLDAGRFQIVVLASVLAAGAITGVVLMRFLGAVAVRPTKP
jgi:putative ABC transport system permease protein